MSGRASGAELTGTRGAPQARGGRRCHVSTTIDAAGGSGAYRPWPWRRPDRLCRAHVLGRRDEPGFPFQGDVQKRPAPRDRLARKHRRRRPGQGNGRAQGTTRERRDRSRAGRNGEPADQGGNQRPATACRRAAIQTLGRFRDPRAVPALTQAYETAGQLTPDIAGPLQTQRSPPSAKRSNRRPSHSSCNWRLSPRRPKLPRRDRQVIRDDRSAAVRALKNFEGSPEAAAAAGRLAETERDVALRDR